MLRRACVPSRGCALPARAVPLLRPLQFVPRQAMAATPRTLIAPPRPKFIPKALRHVQEQEQEPPLPLPSLAELLAPSRKGGPPPLPVAPKTWGDLNVPPYLIERLNQLGLSEPTEVQRLAIPPITRRDSFVVMRAQTGTGKTLAYLLPILAALRSQTKPRPFSTLILAPSRELLAQIGSVVRQFVDFPLMFLVGGPEIGEHIERLRTEQPVIILANPTRMQELLEAPGMDRLFSRLEHLVLDELDHMVPPLGRYAPFKEKQKRIRHPPPALLAISTLLRLSPTTQTVAVSATASARLVRMLRWNKWSSAPTVVGGADVFQPPASLRQFYIRCTQATKVRTLVALIRDLKPKNALAILGTSSRIKAFTKLLNVRGFKAMPLYKAIAEQTDETRWGTFLEQFKSGEIKIVVTTEEMARGLDFSFVDTVFILEIPATTNAYLHLAGRTARVGQPGSVYSLVDDDEYPRLERVMREVASPIEQFELKSAAVAEDDLPSEEPVPARPVVVDPTQIRERPVQRPKRRTRSDAV